MNFIQGWICGKRQAYNEINISLFDKDKIERIVDAVHKHNMSLEHAAKILETMGPIMDRLSPSGGLKWLEQQTSELI